MNEEQIEQIVFKTPQRHRSRIGPEHPGPDENLRRALDIDSFDALNFFIRIHEQLGVEIPESDYGQLNTLAEMRRYLAARLG